MESLEHFYRDTWVEVNLDYIRENIVHMKSRLPNNVEMIAVVKANGYGHGDYQVAKIALESGVSGLAVAFLDEALSLREKGIDAPILVLGATKPEYVNIAAKNNIVLTVFQEEWIRSAKEMLSKNLTISIHLKLDTGMGRIGIRDISTLKKIEELIQEDKRIQLDGVFTHFATADSLDLGYYYEQLELFKRMIDSLKIEPRIIHASNSAASLRESTALFNCIRYGIAMYGLSPSPEIRTELPFSLKESFSLRTKLVHVKKLNPGDKVSYGATYEAQEEEWIGTLAIGYADGWIRKLQGKEVLVNGMRVPIVGRICMDQCMVKLPYDIPVGTIVTLIGRDQNEFISVDELAEFLDTINYEIPCLISNRVPRVYIKDGHPIDVNNPILR